MYGIKQCEMTKYVNSGFSAASNMMFRDDMSSVAQDNVLGLIKTIQKMQSDSCSQRNLEDHFGGFMRALETLRSSLNDSELNKYSLELSTLSEMPAKITAYIPGSDATH